MTAPAPTAVPTVLGLVGDVHGNAAIAARAVRSLALAGAEQIHFLGDFGLVWTGGAEQDLGLKRLRLALDRHRLTAFVTGGNHDGYTEWGRIQADEEGLRWARRNIALLPRGWRGTSVDGTIIASLGGANSIDKPRRIRDRAGWWAEEQITEADLAALGTDRVDILLGHDAPLSPTLARMLAPNQRTWDPAGLEYAELGHAMFHRGVQQVRPRLTVGGHYHLNLDAVERYEALDGTAFETRTVILNANGRRHTIALLDTTTLELSFPAF